MKTFIKDITVVFVIIFCFISSYGQDRYSHLRDLFSNEWRASAINVIQEHLKQHPKCDFEGTEDVVRRMRFFFTKFDRVCAAVFPEKGTETHSVFINIDGCAHFDGLISWNERKGVEIILHELTHLFRRNDRWLCGPDYAKSRQYLHDNPPCRLFGNIQYDSDEITRHIREHFSKELRTLGENNEASFASNPPRKS